MRKKTLRTLSPNARSVAQFANEAASLARRLKNLAKRMNDDDLERKYHGNLDVDESDRAITRILSSQGDDE